MTQMTDMLEELKRIREGVERIEFALAHGEPVKCRGCSSVFRSRREYDEHQCGMVTPGFSDHLLDYPMRRYRK